MSKYHLKKIIIILEIILVALIIFSVIVDNKVFHPEQMNATITKLNIVPDSETYKDSSISFVTSDNYECINLLLEDDILGDTKFEIIDNTQPEIYEKTIYSFLFIKTQTNKLYLKPDTYNRLFN